MSGTSSLEGPVEVHAHKFFVSRADGHVSRSRITGRIFEEDAAPVAVFQAPAGYGKSTLLQQIKNRCEIQDQLTGWLTFDEADNDTRRFSSYMHTLVTTLAGGRKFKGAPLGFNEPGSQYRSDWLIDRLLDLKRPAALFFDEFQALKDRSILAFWRDLLDRIPHNVRIFIGSRSLPEIGFARLVVSGRAEIFRAEDLRFSAEEVRCFFASGKLSPLTGDEIEIIHRRTEGWPAALQLVRLSLPDPSTRQSLGDVAVYRPPELAEYLTESVLTQQPPPIRDFLLRTSLLTRMTAPLCNLVTGRHDSQEVLVELERSGLFVRCVDPHLRWFKYHGLFSFILSEQLIRTQPELAADIRRQAARWHREQGEHEEALHYAVECSDFAFAAETLDIWAERLVVSAHMLTVERWYDRIPFERVAERPSLMLKIAWALVFLRRRQKLPRVMDWLQRWRASGEVSATTSSEILVSIAAMCADNIQAAFTGIERVRISSYEALGYGAFELAAGANMHALRCMCLGDFEGSHQYLIKAKAYNQLGAASFSGGYTCCFEGVNLLLQARLPEALYCLRSGLDEQRTLMDKTFVSAALASCYIWALYEANDLDAADSVFEEYSETMAESAVPDFFAVGYLAMARVHDARGRNSQASEVLDLAERFATANGWRRIVDIINWERVRRGLRNRSLEKAGTKQLENGDRSLPAECVPVSEELQNDNFGRIRIAIRDNAAEIAAVMIAEDISCHPSRLYRHIKLYVLEALAAEHGGAAGAPRRSLRKALALAEEGKYFGVFLEEGEEMLGLLREELESGEVVSSVRRSFLQELLQTTGTNVPELRSKSDLPMEPLTEREIQVLEFLSKGVSNRQMSSRLFVSENTVKFHLKRIYSKLGVNSRIQAVVAARQAGLIC